MSDVPVAVAAALARRREAEPTDAPQPPPDSRLSPGDLRVIEDLAHRPADQRIALVLRVDSANEFAEVLLVHSAPELVTDRDVVLPGSVTSAPYDLVAQTDLRAAVWSLQLGKRIGHLDEVSLAAAMAAGSGSSAAAEAPPGSDDLGLYSGTRLAGPLDQRWSFKESEGDALRDLAVDCTEALLDQGLEWDLDPGLLQPDLLDLAHDRDLLLIELLHWARTRRLTMTDEDLELLVDAGALDVDLWSQFSDLGIEILTVFQELALRVATRVGVEGGTHPVGLVTATHLEVVRRDERIDRIHVLAAREAVNN